ncbi:AsmA family protein [Pannonibacter tanglangensis]|uniref:AsmA family protein n=1 Tax=Pannonibacter tanglangensis TaxID=2750084 RepID=A0ABW9ZM33_9HYPH|nr:AsmA family protein [Pannonibacter sp. XCT-34]NBN65980.1 AsmA family protein [Pannonibacter sp. XCT-34]
MKRALIALAGAGLLVGTAAVVVPLFMPRDAIKVRVVQELEAATGWHLRIDGPVAISLLPTLTLSASDVGLAGAGGAEGLEFAQAEAVQFSLAWGALVGGAVQVTGVRLDSPRLALTVDAEGRTSWAPRQPMKRIESVFTQFGGPAPAPDAGPETPPVEVTGGDQAAVQELAGLTRIGFDDIVIRQGELSYADERSGRTLALTAVDARLSVPDLSGPAKLTGTAVWQGQALTIAAEADSPVKLAGGAAAAVAATLSSGKASLTAKGSLGLAPLALDLRLDGEAASLADATLLAGLGADAAPALAGAVKLGGRIAASPAEVLVHEATLGVGSLALSGAAQAELGGKAPRITGRVQSTGGTLADILTLTGRSLPAEGSFATDLTFAASGQSTAELLASLELAGSVTLKDGRVTGLGLASLAGGDPSADALTGLNMTAKFDGLAKPVGVTGQVSWRGEPFAIRGKVTPAPMLAGLPAPIDIRAQGQRVTLGFDGRVTGAEGVSGDLLVETADLRALLGWLGRPLPRGEGLKAFSLAGQLQLAPEAVRFAGARFALDGIKGTGEGSLRFGAVPKLTATLALESLPLDPYLGAATTGSGGAGGKTPRAGAAAPGGWSNTPVDFGGLGAVDADLTLTAGAITWDKIRIGESALAVTILDGTLAASLERMALYGGTGKGNLSIEGGARQPRIGATLELAGLNGRDFLRDATGLSWLQGVAALSFDLSSQGSSEAELVGNLAGSARVGFTDGAILGVNIPKMVRGLAVETLLGWQTAKDNQTDFNSLSASFSLQNGVAVSSDLVMTGPLVQMTGGGTTDMPAMTLDWRVEPRIVPVLEGIAPQPRKKGEDKQMGGLGVPIVIRGPWAKPQIYPDIQGILENPAAAYQQLEELGGGFVKLLRAKPEDVLTATAGRLLDQATGGRTQIDVQKVLDGEVNDQEVLKAVEEGFGLPQGFLGSLGVPGLQTGETASGAQSGPVVIPEQPVAPPPP